VIRNSTLAVPSADRHWYGTGTSRAAMTIAFLLSLLLHVLAVLALFDTERPAADAARANVVSVHLVASSPAAPSAAPAPSAPVAVGAAPAEPEDVRERGNERPRADAKTSSRRTQAARTDSIARMPDAQARVASAPRQPAPSAIAASAASPDNRAFDSSSDYLRLLAMRLAEVKRYPAEAAARREQGEVLLTFRLDRNGRVLSWQIAHSSGHDELDAEVSRMVAQAAPFPPFPTAWRESSASFTVPIGFSLN
jgi:protein TonB